MQKNRHSKLDIKERLAQKLEFFEKFFNGNAPGQYFPDKEPAEIRESCIKTIEEYQIKGKKLLKVSLTLQQLCESYHKNMKMLETYKESTEYQIERLEVSIEKKDSLSKERIKTIEDLNIYIEDVEKHLLEVSTQRDKAKKELNTTKESIKSLETKLYQVLSENKKKNIKTKEKHFKQIEAYKSELSARDKSLQDFKANLELSERLYNKEKEMNEKLKTNCERMRGQIFELKNKLSEEKLKKSNYKDLYKDLIQIRSNKFRNFSMQTMSELDFDEEFDPDEDKNDLISLEEEQAKEHSVSCSIEIKEGCDGFSENTENMIYLIHPKGLEKRRMEKCEEVFVVPTEKTLEICRNEGILIVNKRKSKENRPVLYTVSELQVKNKVENGKLCIKTKVAQGGREWIEIKRPKNFLSAPASPTVQVVKVNCWDEGKIKRKTETPVVEVSQIEVDESQNPEDLGVRKVENEGYIKSFCQSFKTSCGYGGIIKPKSLYSNLIKLKNPISAIPGAIQGYWQKK